MDDPPALACRLNALSPEQRARHQQLLRRWRGRGQRLERPDGYSFEFDPSPDTARELVEFAALERLCCPFLRLSVVFEPEGGPLRLDLSGPAGVKPFLTHELGLAPDHGL